MAIVVDPFLLDHMVEHTAYCTLVVQDADQPERARRGLEGARAVLAGVGHPEAHDPIVTWTSGVQSTPDGLQFSFDAAGAEDHAGLVEHLLELVVGALAAAGVGVALITHPLAPLRRLQGVLAAASSDDPADNNSADHSSASGSQAGWPVDIPLPEPRQEIYGSTAPDACSRAFMVPHAAEALMAFFEETLPRQGYTIILSIDLTQTEAPYVGRVFFRQGGMTGQVAVTHAGSARHVEISVKADPGDIRAMLANLGPDQHLPPGMRLRVDNRRNAG